MSGLVIGLTNHLSCCCVLGRRPIQASAFMGLCRGAPWPPTWPWALSWCRVIPGAEYLWVCPWSFLLRFFPRWPYPNPSSSTRNQKVSSLSLFLPSQGKNPFRGWNSASKFLPEVSWLHTSSSSHSGIGKSGRLTLCCCLLRCQKLPLRQPAGWILGQQWATTYPYFRNTALKCCACGLSVHIQSPLVSFTSVFPPSDTCCGNWCGNPQDFLRNPSAHRAYLLLTDVNPSDTIFFILVPLRNLNFWKKNLEEECKLL